MKITKALNEKLRLALLGMFLALSSCVFEAAPVSKNGGADTPQESSGYVEVPGNNGQRFLSSFSKSLTEGFTITIDDATAKLGKSLNNTLEIKDPYKAKGQFVLTGLSLHELEFNLDVPLSYNGLTRGLKLTLSDETLYAAVYNMDNEDSYDVKYKVSVAPYDVIGQSGDSLVDSQTGGIFQYSYGDLDWVIDDVLESLTGKSLDADQESGSSSFTVDIAAVIDSLNELEEGTYDGSPYFVWNLPIGEKIFNIGLRADKTTYQWTGIDFPSKSQGGLYELSSDVHLSVSASVETGKSISIASPTDASGYTNLCDSMSIFHKIIDYANAEKFTVVTRGQGLHLKHKEADFEGDGVFYGRTEINEDAYLFVKTDIDLTGKKIRDIYADIDYKFKNATQSVSLMINGGVESAYNEVYASINNLQKAKTSKTVIDSVAGSLKEIINDDSHKDNKAGSLVSLSNSLTEAISAVKESSGVKGLSEGKFDAILSGITSFKGGNDSIVAVIDLSVFGMSGTVTVNLVGDTTNQGVGYIKFDDVRIASFTLDGEIDVLPYDRVKMTDEEKEEYRELRHLESLADQFKRFSDSNQLEVGIEGYVLKKNTISVATQTAIGNKTGIEPLQGFTFSGEFGFDSINNQGTGNLTVVDRKENYCNDHHLKIDVMGPEAVDENNNPTQTDEFVYQNNNPSTNWMLFEYDSKNDSGYSSSENRTQPTSQSGLKGRFAIHSLNGIVDVLGTLMKANDPRLERINSLISGTFVDSILGDVIKGQYFKFLGSDLLSEASLGSRQDVFVLPSALFGSEDDMRIVVNYKGDAIREDGRVVGGEIESLEVDFSLGATAIYVKADVLGYSMREMNWPAIDSSLFDTFTNYSSLKTLAEYAVNTFLIGDKVEVNGNEVIRSAYKIEGSALIDLPVLSDMEIQFRVFVRVEGADIRIAAYLIIPINGVANSMKTFWSGRRYVNLFYHASGNDEGTLLIDRWDDYSAKGKQEFGDDGHWQTRCTGEGFRENLADYLMKDILGLNSTVLGLIGNIDSSSSSTTSIHGEDLIKSFGFNNDMNNPEWYVSLHTSALLHKNTIGDVKLAIGGTYANGKKLFNRIRTTEDVTIASVISVSFSASITNFEPDYRYCWDDMVTELPCEIVRSSSQSFDFSSFTRRYKYLTNFRNVSNSQFYGEQFMVIGDDGRIILADSFASLPINPTPESHI